MSHERDGAEGVCSAVLGGAFRGAMAVGSLFGVLGVAVGIGGCGGNREAREALAFPTPSRLSPVESSAERPENPFAGEISRALELLGRVRQLPPKRPVKGEVIGRAEMVERVKRSLRDEVPADAVEAQAEMLFALGAVPADFDYEGSLLELVEDQLAGFYEPDDETMYLGEDLGETARWATLAHELVHALQDQYYDLGARVEYREDGTDEQSATHALAEGDATSAMFDVLQGRPSTEIPESSLAWVFRGSAALSSGGDVPDLLKRSLVSPYVDGLRLVQWARRRGGWDAVGAIWSRPPTSTEQVLHPEKWEANEPPRRVAVPPGPSDEWELDYRDVMGEQSLRLVFEEWMPRFRAEAAASDWGGDHVAIYSKGSKRAMAWRVVFDEEQAAHEAAVAFARGVLGAGRVGSVAGGFAATWEEGESALRKGVVCVERAERGPFAVLWSGLGVGVVGGPYDRQEGRPVLSAGTCSGVKQWLTRVATAGATETE